MGYDQTPTSFRLPPMRRRPLTWRMERALDQLDHTEEALD